jgi:hypothetical protein
MFCVIRSKTTLNPQFARTPATLYYDIKNKIALGNTSERDIEYELMLDNATKEQIVAALRQSVKFASRISQSKTPHELQKDKRDDH